ncbi:MAG: Trk system potassium uptake protein TrkI [Alphaproteobacteria bacterium MarineAlpha5_Bin9]|nr:MAG: Trk system potassium uptake protein TrkI [Alphaproteobacteria bacterium MarineAlpha5_Bin9]|tara:strand:+ start:1949 stop:3397 length:1449 start_codon:yes stop_codon:yes gene_type:complete
MRDFRPVFFIIGVLLCIQSIVMLIPAIIDLINQNTDWQIFLFSSLITFLTGLMLFFSFRNQKNKINLRQAYVLTIFSWILIALFSCIPFIFGSSNLNFSDAFFESISGITTTGATVIINLDELTEGILIWRSLLQWFGGVGIIVLALAILPTLQIGGMQLLHMEHDDPYEKTLPKVGQFVLEILLIYLLFTLTCSILYSFAGMDKFDSIAHAMTTIATGGFSTHDLSFGYYDSLSIQLVSILFMIIGSLPFVVYLKIIHGDWKVFFKDDQIKLFLLLILIISCLTSLWLFLTSSIEISKLFQISLFNIVSILTGTGYSNSNYSLWGGFGIVIMFTIMFIGGCAGSTTGGIKIFRLQLLFRGAQSQIRKLIQPHGVFITTFNKKTVSEDAFNSIMGFFFMYILIFIIASISLSFLGLDYLTAISAAASAISNVGPGLGELIGPSGNYNSLPVLAKWILSLTMLIGRLEIFTLLVVVSFAFWRK